MRKIRVSLKITRKKRNLLKWGCRAGKGDVCKVARKVRQERKNKARSLHALVMLSINQISKEQTIYQTRTSTDCGTTIGETHRAQTVNAVDLILGVFLLTDE